MKSKLTYQQLENQIAELKKQNKILKLKFSSQNEEKENYADEFVQRIEGEVLKECIGNFKSYFESNKEIMLQVNTETKKIIDANKSAIDFYGYSKNELLQKSICNLNTLLPDEIDELLKKAIKNKSNVFQFQHELANGKIKDVEVFSSPMKFNNELSLIITVYDITERKKIEKVLLENKYRHEKSQALGHVGNWEYNIETELLWVSDETKRIYGFNIDSNNFSLEQTENCIPERGRVHQALIDIIEDDKKYDLEFEIIPADNSPRRIIHSIAELERDTSNNPMRVRGVILDITEHKKVEEALKSSEEKFAKAFQQNPAISGFSDLETGEYTEVNQTFYEKFKLKKEEVIGIAADKIFELDPTFREKAMAQLKSKGKVRNIETTIRSKNGLSLDVLMSADILKIKGKDYNFTTAIDITDRKKIEQALKESEFLYKETQKIGKMGGWSYDVASDKMTFTDTIYDIYGKKFLSAEEGIIFYHPEDREKVWKSFSEVILKQKPYDLEVRFINAQGDDLFVRTIGQPIVENEKVIRIYGNLVDITEQKTAELELKASEQKLKVANATKDKFFSIIAHDLRSPFNAMLGFSNILNNDFDKYDREKKKKFVGIIDQGLNDTFKLLENLLYWSRSQRGIIKFKPEKMSLYLLCDEISKLLIQAADNKSIELICKIPENIIIIADKEMFSTIFRNLVSNAIKFTPKFGKILVRAQITDDNKSVEVCVKDNGVGISKEIQAKIFDIGENTSTKGTENEKGTGLGLILCKEFIDKHNGEIWIESEIGKGSSFYFTVPI